MLFLKTNFFTHTDFFTNVLPVVLFSTFYSNCWDTHFSDRKCSVILFADSYKQLCSEHYWHLVLVLVAKVLFPPPPAWCHLAWLRAALGPLVIWFVFNNFLRL